VPGVDVHAEFVVASAEVLDKCMSGADDTGRTDPFQAPHRPQPGFEPSMIGLDRVIGVLLHVSVLLWAACESLWRRGAVCGPGGMYEVGEGL
jgi:hypothetical protein